MLELKKQRSLLKPRVHLVNIDTVNSNKESIRNLDNLKKLFQNYSVEILNLELHTWAGDFAERAKKDPLFRKLSNLQDDKRNFSPCLHVFSSFVITWDGDVVPCCRDLKKDYVIGNIKEHSIMELWNSEKIIQLRQKQILRQYKDIPLCRECTQLWNNYSVFKLAKNSFQKFVYLRFGHFFGSGEAK